MTEIGEVVNSIMKESFPTIVDEHFTANMESLLDAVAEGKVKKYVSDFPNNTTVGAKGCIVTPHLGASTAESEITDAPDARELTDVKGHVSYEHVSFHYSDDNTPAALPAWHLLIILPDIFLLLHFQELLSMQNPAYHNAL